MGARRLAVLAAILAATGCRCDEGTGPRPTRSGAVAPRPSTVASSVNAARAAPSPETTAAPTTAARLKLANWNLEWLNSEDKTGMVKREAADYDRLKGYADKLAADIVAIQEVDGAEAAKRVFDPAK